ncbi:hypothetical protein IFM89_023052 [Coptis chinensis]|uniref:Kinesin motor domain-containing protein n=1 Tax=Coptis chinensis TaxID=261450 RepID=A0A835J042_9MAGN|nr:hypothetical protein IFM89_023052 [Coptis chinensis]
MKKMVKALRSIVPGADQMNTATVIDEAVTYLKSLKVEVKKHGLGNFICDVSVQAQREKLMEETSSVFNGKLNILGEISSGCSSVVEFNLFKDNELQILCGDSSRKLFKFDHVFGPQDDQAGSTPELWNHNQNSVFPDQHVSSGNIIEVSTCEQFFIRIDMVDICDGCFVFLKGSSLLDITRHDFALDGFNVCIFAYGQTGTGKTFTMEGTPESRGVHYRTLEELFRISEERSCTMKYDLSVSMLEVYNEKIRDLLVEDSNHGVKK